MASGVSAPAGQDYQFIEGDCASVARFIESRSLSRARSMSGLVSQETTDVSKPKMDQETNAKAVSPPWTSLDQQKLIQELDADLKLSARVGEALLKDKQLLEEQLKAWEDLFMKQSQKLANDAGPTASAFSAYSDESEAKPSWSLKVQGLLRDKRLEAGQCHLDQSESLNRTLQSEIEESRKTISRLTSDSLKLLTLTSQHAVLNRTCEDLTHELAQERKRANALDAKHRKIKGRLAELEERLTKANGDLSEMRQDKVLRSRKSHEALAQAKARMSSNYHRQISGNPHPHGKENQKIPPMPPVPGMTGTGYGHENVEAQELLKLMESLVLENELLRSESIDLREMLEGVRDEQVEREQDSADECAAIGVNEMDESSQEKLPSTAESESDTYPTTPFTPASSTANTFLTLSVGAQDASINALPAPPTTQSRVIPFGRRNSRRASSVDIGIGLGLGSMNRVRCESAPVTPDLGVLRTSTSPPDRRGTGQTFRTSSSTGSDMIGDTSRANSNWRAGSSEGLATGIRRGGRPRPLSLSLGPSLFPQSVPEHDSLSLSDSAALSSSVGAFPRKFRTASQSRSPRLVTPRRFAEDNASAHDKSNSQCSCMVTVSIMADSTKASFSDINLGTPVKQSPTRCDPDLGQVSVVASVDFGTQTCLLASPLRLDEDGTTTHSRRRMAELDETAGSSSILLDTGTMPQNGHGSASDPRTAALGTLIEHATKLLHRIQTADVGNQEKRLKKQNLVGADVKYLSQANLRDLVTDIEGLRTHFKKIVENERSHAAREDNSVHSQSLSESLILRRDFVALVKLLRDLLFETSRLRSLVNRVEMDPTMATDLRELDIPNIVDIANKASRPSPGLLAPITRFFASVVSNETEVVQTMKASTLSVPRPVVKGGGSSAVSSAAVNVEFESGAVRHHTLATDKRGSSNVATSQSRAIANEEETVKKKTGAQVKRDLSSIFAGGLVQTTRPERHPQMTSTPFGRLLAYARPAMSATANAVIDSIPHAPQPPTAYQPTLLERQLRPRGYSDSSIRSTILQPANPHHKLISPATLAVANEPKDDSKQSAAILIKSAIDQPDTAQLSKQLTVLSASMVRKPSGSNLRARASHAQLRSVSNTKPNDENIPPVPVLPISITKGSAIIPHQRSHIAGAPSETDSLGGAATLPNESVNNSLFGSLWAHKASTSLRPSTTNESRPSDFSSSFQAKNKHRPSLLADRAGRVLG